MVKEKLAFIIVMLCATFLVPLAVFSQSDDFKDELQAIQTEWAVANYEMQDKKAQKKAFDELSGKAQAFSEKYPGRAEPLIWEGIVLSTYAGVKGGLGALGLAKRARVRLEAAAAIDPQALNGSVYTSLGTLYYKVPGRPLGFGDDEKAAEYLQKALAINPGGIDPNFFYGEFLMETGRYDEAIRYLEKGLEAPARPDRALADKGRRAELQSLLLKARQKAS